MYSVFDARAKGVISTGGAHGECIEQCRSRMYQSRCFYPQDGARLLTRYLIQRGARADPILPLSPNARCSVTLGMDRPASGQSQVSVRERERGRQRGNLEPWDPDLAGS
jgi:hypothetical protein